MKLDAIVVGGGIVGLATAYNLLLRRPSTRVLLLEKERELASHQTGRNSGVIHSGIYYKPGSLKSRNCRDGYKKLLEFCRTHGIAHDICGKLIVATQADQLPRLEALHKRAQEVGLQGMKILDPSEMREIEPNVAGVKALQVRETGIVDYTGMCRRLADLIQASGGTIQTGTTVTGLQVCAGGCEVITTDRTLECRTAIVCGGLHSDRLARLTHKDLMIRIIPFRGEYYELAENRRHLVRHLIYPVPDPAFPFLGVHFTRMIGGGVEAGPNAVLAFGREAYKKTDFVWRDVVEIFGWPGFRSVARRHWRAGLGEFHRSWSKKAFVRALQGLVPRITDGDLVPGAAGIRAQACHRDGSLLDDFYILEDENVIHVCNAPSPAATASLAIGDQIVTTVLNRLG